jgi:hypothetical protein
MRRPFKGVINLDIRDSTPDREPFLAQKAPEGAPNVLVAVDDDTGLAAVSSEYRPTLEFSGGRIIKVVVAVERHLAAAFARA